MENLILNILNLVLLGALTVAYFIQNNQLKFMKSIVEVYQPEKLKHAQELFEKGVDYEYKLKFSQKTREIIQESSKQFQEVNKTMLEQYNECLNMILPFYFDKTWEEREKHLTRMPKNAEIFRFLLVEYDAGRLPVAEK